MDEMMNNLIIELRSDICHRMICEVGINSYGHIRIGIGRLMDRGESARRSRFRGEWEIGTFHNSWRVFEGDKKIADGSDFMNYSDVGEFLSEKILGMEILDMDDSEGGVVLKLANNFNVNFMESIDEKEMVHVFCPENRVVFRDVNSLWRSEKSRKLEK